MEKKALELNRYFMRKKLYLIILILISTLGLVSCREGSDSFIKKLKNDFGIKYLSEAKVEYFYRNISGFDSAGIYYCVFKYEEEPTKFFEQFKYRKSEDEPDESFQEGRNLDFEKKVESLLEVFVEVKKDYNNFKDEYKLNWDKEYLYKNDSPNRVTMPMIYFKSDFRLIIIKDQD